MITWGRKNKTVNVNEDFDQRLLRLSEADLYTMIETNLMSAGEQLSKPVSLNSLDMIERYIDHAQQAVRALKYRHEPL